MARPPWPPALLIDLAADREPQSQDLTREIVDIALDHRMGGLLWSWAQSRPVDEALKGRLALADLRVQAHMVRVWSLLESSVGRLVEAGIEVASLKGPTAEARWYARPGERPSSDVDLWLSPYQVDRAGDALRLLQPDHPWEPFFDELAAQGRVQTVTLDVGGVEVDLHLDLLKTGLTTRQSTLYWDACEWWDLSGGMRVRVLDPTTSLLLFLVHLNKDRFQRLLGYADVVRVVNSGADLDRLRVYATREGLGASVGASLGAVSTDLGMAWLDMPPGSRTWRAVWRRSIRLRGSEGRRRFRRRALGIVALSDRGVGERSAALWQSVVPPAQVRSAKSRR